MRADGRAFDEIRPIVCEVGVAPRVHGSALFTRGETQAFVTTTLGTNMDSKKMENYGGESPSLGVRIWTWRATRVLSLN